MASLQCAHWGKMIIGYKGRISPCRSPTTNHLIIPGWSAHGRCREYWYWDGKDLWCSLMKQSADFDSMIYHILVKPAEFYSIIYHILVKPGDCRLYVWEWLFVDCWRWPRLRWLLSLILAAVLLTSSDQISVIIWLPPTSNISKYLINIKYLMCFNVKYLQIFGNIC